MKKKFLSITLAAIMIISTGLLIGCNEKDSSYNKESSFVYLASGDSVSVIYDKNTDLVFIQRVNGSTNQMLDKDGKPMTVEKYKKLMKEKN